MTSATATATGVGPLLREWRQREGVSQLDPALGADSSARPISFDETGKAQPSRAMVLRLAEHLDAVVAWIGTFGADIVISSSSGRGFPVSPRSPGGPPPSMTSEVLRRATDRRRLHRRRS